MRKVSCCDGDNFVMVRCPVVWVLVIYPTSVVVIRCTDGCMDQILTAFS